MTFGNRLRYLRESKNMSQIELAKQFKITSQSVSQYELDKRTPDMHMIKAFADYFNVSTDYLLCRTDDPSTIAFKGEQIPKALRDADVELIEMIKEAKESGLTKDEFEEILEFTQKIKKK